MSTVAGGCLCAAVRYRVAGALRDVVNCHCTQCRRTSGHFVAATACAAAALAIDDAQHCLRWYRSSAFARRGFCHRCGASLFWQRDGADYTSIMAGTLDNPTGLRTAQHVYVADKGDYYALEDGLPAYAGEGPDAWGRGSGER